MRQFLFVFLILGTLTTAGQSAKSVKAAPEALFPFDPISGRYVGRSLAPVAKYVEAWRAEGLEVELQLDDTLLLKGYKIYSKLEDSTLIDSILSYLSATITSIDTTELNSDNIYTFPQSRQYLDHFASDIECIKRFYSTPLRQLDHNQQFDPYAPSEFSGTMHDFQIETSGADLSLFAPPRLNAVLNGELYLASLLNLFRYDNQLVVIELSGQEVKSLLEKTYSARYYRLSNPQSDLLNSNLPRSMHTSLAGAKYRVNLTKMEGSRIEMLELDPKKIYRVAMNSFMASKHAKQMVEVGDYTTLLITYLRSQTAPKNREQWHLSPERWVEQIKARESAVLDPLMQ